MSQLDQTQSLPLKAIHLPAEPGIWPLPWGYWALLAFVIFALVAVVVGLRMHKQKRRAKLAAIQLLKYESDSLTPSAANEILRQAALSYFPRQDIAKLTGNEWLNFLDSQLAAPRFTTNSELWMNTLYRAEKCEPETQLQLIEDCFYWLHNALPPKRQFKNWNKS